MPATKPIPEGRPLEKTDNVNPDNKKPCERIGCDNAVNERFRTELLPKFVFSIKISSCLQLTLPRGQRNIAPQLLYKKPFCFSTF